MSKVLYDTVFYTNTDFTDPLKSVLFVWMSISCIFNLAIIIRSLQGWLINSRITKQVIVASSLAIVWVSMFLIEFFVQHRAFSIIVAWSGYPLTLLIALQHIELLKLFVSLSDFWTDRKCRIVQLAMIIAHILITFPGYIWPLGLEKDPLWGFVNIVDLAVRPLHSCLGCSRINLRQYLRRNFDKLNVETFERAQQAR